MFLRLSAQNSILHKWPKILFTHKRAKLCLRLQAFKCVLRLSAQNNIFHVGVQNCILRTSAKICVLRLSAQNCSFRISSKNCVLRVSVQNFISPINVKNRICALSCEENTFFWMLNLKCVFYFQLRILSESLLQHLVRLTNIFNDVVTEVSYKEPAAADTERLILPLPIDQPLFPNREAILGDVFDLKRLKSNLIRFFYHWMDVLSRKIIKF